MSYNRFLYNTALYNAGREEIAGIARSIIQAHTGPHIQAVVAGSGGVSLISDFIITEGEIKKPPSQFKFPDLGAFIRTFQVQAPTVDGLAVDSINAFIRGFGFKNLPAALYPSDKIPDLAGIIFGLFEKNLIAIITGQLGQKDLPAIIQATVANLAAVMLGVAAPNLRGQIFVQTPGNLGARIHAPLDLPASLFGVNAGDISGIIQTIQFKDLAGIMLGIPSPPSLLLRFVGFLEIF